MRVCAGAGFRHAPSRYRLTHDDDGRRTEGEESMTNPITRRVPLRSAPNLRDLGGLRAAGGVVRTGAVYRSATLARLEGDDIEAFLGLGITTVYDLRTVGERSASPDQLPDGVRLVGLDVLADSTTDVAAGVGQL